MWVEQHMVRRTSPFQRSCGVNKRRWCHAADSRYDTVKITQRRGTDEYSASRNVRKLEYCLDRGVGFDGTEEERELKLNETAGFGLMNKKFN